MVKKNLPAVASDGAIMSSVGKYARSIVLQVFEDMGGVDAMTKWADSNPDDFYTKLFPKIISRESEVSRDQKSVEDYLEAIDAEVEEVHDKAVDADFEDV